jgi:hypothetical protein
MSINNADSPAVQAMDEAIALAIEERSPYPERAAFVDAGGAGTDAAIRRAVDEDRAIVLVSADGSTSILRQEPAHS